MNAKAKNQEKSKISFSKISKNKLYHTKVSPKSFHLNGDTIGFCRQTPKLQLQRYHTHGTIIDSGSEGISTMW